MPQTANMNFVPHSLFCQSLETLGNQTTAENTRYFDSFDNKPDEFSKIQELPFKCTQEKLAISYSASVLPKLKRVSSTGEGTIHLWYIYRFIIVLHKYFISYSANLNFTIKAFYSRIIGTPK